MLITNQRLDKLAAARADFIAREMLPPDRGPLPGANTNDDNDNDVDDGDDDGGPIDDVDVMADVQLARTRGMPPNITIHLLYYSLMNLLRT